MEIPIWEWPDNSPYLKPIENVRNLIKNNVQEKHYRPVRDAHSLMGSI